MYEFNLEVLEQIGRRMDHNIAIVIFYLCIYIYSLGWLLFMIMYIINWNLGT